MDENNQYKNQLFNMVIDKLFNDIVSYEQLTQALIKEELLNFFFIDIK